MFAALNPMSGLVLPKFETRKALVIINMQNDSLYEKDEMYMTKNRDFVPRLKEMIPAFRTIGDVIWVRTELGVLPPVHSKDASRVEHESVKLAEKNRTTRNKEEEELQDDTLDEEARRSRLPVVDPKGDGDVQTYHPSSRAKSTMTRASADTRAEKRSADLQVFDDGDNVLEEHMTKPRKGQQARFFIAGTKGADICDELLDIVDESQDLILTKHHYSAFDQTQLLMSLRSKIVTEIFLCGCFTNVSVYATAADAVQHGLEVTVVEDCLGYRNEEKHEEAMRQMADIMGVNGVDSGEIIEDSGGPIVGSDNTPGVTIQRLSLSRGVSQEQASLVAGGQASSEVKQGPPKSTRSVSASSDIPGSLVSAVRRTGKLTTRGNETSTAKATHDPSLNLVRKQKRDSWLKPRPQSLGPDDTIGGGDSRILHDVLSSSIADDGFYELKREVLWKTMLHRSGEVPRLVAVQGDMGKDGEVPIYRHPADESPPLLPFTPLVHRVRQEVEKRLSQPFNHALIQLYRDGIDNISEHADKTLDIIQGSSIVNVSLGAQRTMTLRTKKSKSAHGSDSPGVRQAQRIRMPHNSIFVLGPQTNREWLHGVRADKRPDREKTDEERSFGGERISITFRQIGTFMSERQNTIWGSGATNKTKEKAGYICNQDADQMDAMIKAFGRENRDVDFDWDAEYGSGFDIVNLINEKAKLILCNDTVANHRVQISLCDNSVPCTIIEPGPRQTPELTPSKYRFQPWTHGLSNTESLVFKAADAGASEVEGDLAILFYLENNYPSSVNSASKAPYTTAQLFSCAAESNELLYLWRELRTPQEEERTSSPTHRFNLEEPVTPNLPVVDELHNSLQPWEDWLADADNIAGDSWTIVDCAFWPVLNQILTQWEQFDRKKYTQLVAYHKRGLQRDSVKEVMARAD